MKKRAVYSIIIIMLVFTSCTIGGSFYMLNFSLTPNAKILSKDADSYPYMYRNYPFLRPWVDSLKQVNALKDTFIINPQGIQLHAFYIAAPAPTSKTAVIVHGYTDNAIRMFVIWDIISCFPTCNIRERAKDEPSKWDGKTELMFCNG